MGGEQELTEPQTPFALSMIICDAVHIDQSTGKAFLLGCFGSIGAEAFPAQHPHMTVFVEVTDCRGRTPFAVRVIDVDERRAPLVEATTEVDMADPLEIRMLILPLEDLVFPEPGEYRVQLLSGDAPLMERRLLLRSSHEETTG
jgi:hypothetical protein